MVGMQEASCGWITSIGIASTPAMFLGDRLSCLRMMVPWFGILPVQACLSAVFMMSFACLHSDMSRVQANSAANRSYSNSDCASNLKSGESTDRQESFLLPWALLKIETQDEYTAGDYHHHSLHECLLLLP